MKTGETHLSYVYGGGETSFLSMSWGEMSHQIMEQTEYGAKSLCTISSVAGGLSLVTRTLRF